MLKNNFEFLKHIRDEALYIVEKCHGLNKDEFLKDGTLKRAFIRSLEIIGEATKKLSDDFKKSYHSVDWKKMTGLRDVLIHQYFGVDYNIVWDVVANHIPLLLDRIQNILKQETN